MIVVVIVGVLAMIALPSYTDYVRRGQIQEGTTALSDGAVKMEQFFQDSVGVHTYAGGPCPNPTTYFTFACPDTATPTTTFLITATGRDNLTGFIYTIDQAAARSSTTPWSNNAKVACWIIRKGDKCT
jgi:type IV pilus assembly protein PilE